MTEISENQRSQEITDSPVFSMLKTLRVNKDIFVNQDLATSVLNECLFDAGSREPLPALPSSNIEIIKESLKDSSRTHLYNNQPLPGLNTLSSGLLRLLLKNNFQVMNNSLIDVNSAYNANAISLLSPELDSRLNGDRTIRLAQQKLRGAYPNNLLMRWGGDEFLFLSQTPSTMEQADFEQHILFLIGPESFFYKKGMLVQEPITFKTEGFSLQALIDRFYVDKSSKNIEELTVRINSLKKHHQTLAPFLDNLQLDEANLESLNTVLEIVENGYVDPLLHQEALKLANANTYINATEFAAVAKSKNKPQTLMMITIPNALRLSNSVSHQFGDEKLVELFKLLVTKSNLSEFNLLRRGPDFYVLVDQDEANSLADKLSPDIDNFSQQIMQDQAVNGEEITIPHGVIQSTSLDFQEAEPPLKTLGKAMTHLNQTSFQEIKKRQKQFLQENSLTMGIKNFVVDYYSLLLKRGYPRVEQIFKNKQILDELSTEYQILAIVNKDNPKYAETKTRILKKILSGLEIDSSDVKME